MNKFHVIAISTKGYHRMASYASKAEALADITKRNVRLNSYVLRDGTTGKRYSINECRGMV